MAKPHAGIEDATRAIFGFTSEAALAAHIQAAVQAAIKAAVPGRQNKKNLEVGLAAGFRAAAATLRRRARARG